MNTITYRAARSIADASKAEASIGALWAKAYADAVTDMGQDGATLRDMAKAITSAGIKCSKDTASDFVDAHALTVHGDVFTQALTERIGEGKVMRAHSLIAKARKNRGVKYVRAVLATLDPDQDADALRKAMAKAVRELDASKPETDKDKDKDKGNDDTTGNDDAHGDDDTTDATVNADALLAALAGPTVALRKAMEDGYDMARMDAWLTEVAAIAHAHKRTREGLAA